MCVISEQRVHALELDIALTGIAICVTLPCVISVLWTCGGKKKNKNSRHTGRARTYKILGAVLQMLTKQLCLLRKPKKLKC